MMKEEWLDILRSLASSIAVTHMTYRHPARKFRDLGFIEDLCHKSVTLDSVEDTFIIYGHDAATLLSSVLKGVQAVVSQACSILNTVDSKHSTLMVELIIPVFVTIAHFVRFNFIDPRSIRG